MGSWRYCRFCTSLTEAKTNHEQTKKTDNLVGLMQDQYEKRSDSKSIRFSSVNVMIDLLLASELKNLHRKKPTVHN